MARRSFLPSNLPQLQNLIKRDGSAYKEEFLQQLQHYQALTDLFLIDPTQNSQKLQELVTFISQVCHCYPEETATFPEGIQTLLRQHGTVLHPEVRMSLCRGLILMRNKGFLHTQRVLELFFELFRCQDKALRTVLYLHIVADIKRMNSKHKNNQINKGLQNFMYTMLSDANPVAAKMSLDVMMEMYRKNVWNDANTVNVITTACFSPFTKVAVGALQFFLTSNDSADTTEDTSSEDESDGEVSKALRTMVISKQLTKKGKKRERKLAKAMAKIKRRRKHKPKHPPTFSALYLINDPQSFAEKLFKKLEHSKERFEVRLMLMSLISRLVGLHQLFLFNFYPFLQRYLQPHQQEVTKILTFLAQASHELVPAEVLEPCIRAIVNTFVTERNSSEVMTVGLNAVREVCVRCPLSMTTDLLQDLTSYKSYRDKSVMMAARSLIHLFRELNPSMLKRKDRGKPAEYASSVKIKDYGELTASEYVPGSELVDLPSSDAEEMSPSCESSMEETCDYDYYDTSDKSTIVDDWNGSTSRGRKRKISSLESRDLPSLKKQRENKAAVLSQSRLFTQEEFKKIQLKQITSRMASKRSKKEAISAILCTQDERRQASGEVLSESLIDTIDHKKQKLDKEGRVAVAQAGREGRQKYGYSKKRLRAHCSTTNKEKKRSKAYTMIKQKRSVRGKKKRSFREKQMALKKSLLKQKRRT